MRTFPVLVCTALIAACAPRQARPSEAVRPPDLLASLPENDIVVAVDRLTYKTWTVKPSTDISGQQSLEFELPHSDAHMSMTAYLAVIDLRSLLLVSKGAYDEDGFVSSSLEPLGDGNGARFTISGPPRGRDGPTCGEVRAWEVPGSGNIVVLSGLWLARIHGPASADFNAVARGVKAKAK